MRSLLVPTFLAALLAPLASAQDASPADLEAWTGGLDRKTIALVHANRLAMCGERATPLLIGVLERGGDEAKKRALWVLLRTLDPAARPALHAMLRRGEQVDLVCRVLARMRAEDSVAVLVERLESDREAGEPYVSALGAFGTEPAIEALRGAMARPTLAMRAALAILLHRPDDEPAREALTRLAASTDPQERLRGIWAMGRSRDERFLPAVEAALQGDAGVRRTAIEALGEIGGERATGVLSGLAGGAGAERRRIARAVWRASGRDEDLARYLERFADQFTGEASDKADYDERLAAIAELGDVPAEHAAAGLAPFLGAASPSLGETVEALRVLDGRVDVAARFLAEYSKLLGSQDLNLKAYAWMLAERATGEFYEWPNRFEQTWLEDGAHPGSRDQLTLGLAHRPRVRRTGAKFLAGLSDGVGILLVAPAPETMRVGSEHTFFGIDVAFLDDEGRLVSTASLEPASGGEAVAPRPVRYAIVVRKGYLAERDFGAGDRLVVTPAILNARAE